MAADVCYSLYNWFEDIFRQETLSLRSQRGIMMPINTLSIFLTVKLFPVVSPDRCSCLSRSRILISIFVLVSSTHIGYAGEGQANKREELLYTCALKFLADDAAKRTEV